MSPFNYLQKYIEEAKQENRELKKLLPTLD